MRNIFNKFIYVMFLLTMLSSCATSDHMLGNDDNELVIQYKDIEFSLLNKSINRVSYLPVGNGNLNIKSSAYGDLTVASNSYDSLTAIANKLAISYTHPSELPHKLFSNSLSSDKQPIILQVFQIATLGDVSEISNKQLSFFVLKKNDNTFEVWIVNLDDNDVYYVLHGFKELNLAKNIIKNIRRTY